MKTYTIYKATNKINGKSYVGFDGSWPNRKRQHERSSTRGSNFHFHCALRFYGFENFEWEIVFQSTDKNYTHKIMEPFFISIFNTLVEGYNMTEGGDGILGFKHSEEAILKIKEKRKTQIFTEEHRRKISLALSQRTISDTTREKLSNAKKKENLSEETLKKLSESQKGKKMSDEARLKMSIAKKGNIPWNKGKKITRTFS